MNNVLVFTGRKGVGKDARVEACIDYLASHITTPFFMAERLAFGDTMKDLIHDIFPWMPARPTPEEKEVPVDHPDNVLGLSNRTICARMFGPEFEGSLRKIDPNVIVNRFFREHKDKFEGLGGVINQSFHTLYIISDLRFVEEYEFVKQHGWPIVRINCDNPAFAPDEVDIEYFIDTIKPDYEYTHDMSGTPEDFVPLFKQILEEKFKTWEIC